VNKDYQKQISLTIGLCSRPNSAHYGDAQPSVCRLFRTGLELEKKPKLS